MSPAFSELSILFTSTIQSSPTSPMSSLNKQLAQAVAAITMLSNSMAAMQNQVVILTQNVHEQNQRLLQPIAPTSLSPLNILLPPLSPSPPCQPSLYLQGQYMLPPPVRTKDCSPSLFHRQTRWDWVIHQLMYFVHEWPEVRVSRWRC